MPPRLALGQIAIAATHRLLVSAVLHQMLAATSDIDSRRARLRGEAAYVTANTAGILSHAGRAEGDRSGPSLGPGANVIGALMAFRAIWFLVPSFIGGVVFGASEIVRQHYRTAAGLS